MPVVADEVRRAADEDDVVAADEDLLEEARHGPRAVRVPRVSDRERGNAVPRGESAPQLALLEAPKQLAQPLVEQRLLKTRSFIVYYKNDLSEHR